MNIQEQVARLEALLTRVQHNGAQLRQERGFSAPGADSGLAAGGFTARGHSAPVVTPRAAEPHGTPTKLLPTSIEAAQAADQAYASAPMKPLSSIPAAAQTLIPASNEPLETDFTGANATGAMSYEDSFEHEESIEHTKPLWVGLSEPPMHAPPAAPATLPPAAFTPIAPGNLPPSLPPLPEDTFEPAAHAPLDSESHAIEATEADLRDSSPPLSGERASARSPSLPPQDGPMSLEEPLASAVGAQIPTADFGSDPDAGFAISTASLDTTFDDDREGRITDAPASALGATINLPEDAASVELELAEPPPSSLRSIDPAHQLNEDELEAELPRTSFRAGYDDSLSSPPKAREDLIAHDLNVRDRVSSAPAPARELTELPRSNVSYATAQSELPPVLSSRPHSPVTIPPHSAVEPLHASARRGETEADASFDAQEYPNIEVAPQASFDTQPNDESLSSIPPYQTSVSDVVVSARPAPRGVEFVPSAHAIAATFDGAAPRTKDASFLELLDTSLSLSVRE